MLSTEDIKWLENEFGGPVNWIDGAPNGFPASWQGWAYVAINPLPSYEERKIITADICRGEFVRIEGGRLKHSSRCQSKSHYITGVAKPKKIEQCLNTLSDDTFNISIYSNLNESETVSPLNGQPLVMAFNPPIDYIRYPGHLHINTGGFVRENGISYMPDSLCYRKNLNDLMILPLRERLLETLFEISMWLFRHQIWEKTGLWIGDHEPSLGPETFCHHLSPYCYCRCGSKIKYLDCCMRKDIVVGASGFPKCDRKSDTEIFLRYCINSWEERVGKPQHRALELLRKNFNDI